MKGNVAIFIPAYNEERSIAAVVLLAKKYGRVFVIDDGSGDRTGGLAASAGAQVVRHNGNFGYGAAVKTALRLARRMDESAFVFLDGDFQHDPAEIGVVAAPVLDGKADVSLGSRFLGKFVSAHMGRKEGVMLLNTLSSMHSGEGRWTASAASAHFQERRLGS